MFDFQIDISDQQTHLAIQPALLRNVMQSVLREEQVDTAELSVALVDDAVIHRVNRDYLSHDYPTDVISFLLEKSAGPAGDHLDGELVISTETALREAPHHGWSAHDELVLYVVHGLLHLCGYDDLQADTRRTMRERERQLLAAWKLTPSGLEA